MSSPGVQLTKLSWNDVMVVERSYRYAVFEPEQARQKARTQVPNYLTPFIADIEAYKHIPRSGDRAEYNVEVRLEASISKLVREFYDHPERLADSLHTFLMLMSSQEAQEIAEQVRTLFHALRTDQDQLGRALMAGLSTMTQLVCEIIQRHPQTCHQAMDSGEWARLMKSLPPRKRRKLFLALRQIDKMRAELPDPERLGHPEQKNDDTTERTVS